MLDKAAKLDADNSSIGDIKRVKFVQFAEKRTRNAIKSIRVIGKLGNRNAYKFDDSDVQKIVRALSREIEALRGRMSSSGSKETVDFKL